jgi:hypothetical protein
MTMILPASGHAMVFLCVPVLFADCYSLRAGDLLTPSTVHW